MNTSPHRRSRLSQGSQGPWPPSSTASGCKPDPAGHLDPRERHARSVLPTEIFFGQMVRDRSRPLPLACEDRPQRKCARSNIMVNPGRAALRRLRLASALMNRRPRVPGTNGLRAKPRFAVLARARGHSRELSQARASHSLGSGPQIPFADSLPLPLRVKAEDQSAHAPATRRSDGLCPRRGNRPQPILPPPYLQGRREHGRGTKGL